MSEDSGTVNFDSSSDSGTLPTAAVPPSLPRPTQSVSAPVLNTGASPGRTSAALWRQNAELQQQNQELELEVQSLRAATARHRLSTRSGSSSLLASRRASVATSEEDRGLVTQLAALEAQLTEAQHTTAAAQRELTSIKAELVTARRSMSAAEAQAAACRQEVESVQAEAADARAGFDLAQKQVAVLLAELEAARAEAAAAGAGVSRLSEQLAAAQHAADTARRELQEMRIAFEEAQQEEQVEFSETQGRLGAAEAHAAQLGAQLAVQEQEAARWQDQAAALRQELADAHAALQGARKSLADARAALKAAEGQIADAAAERAKVAGLEQRVAELLEHGERASKPARADASITEKLKIASRVRQGGLRRRAGTRSLPSSPTHGRSPSPACFSSRPASPAVQHAGGHRATSAGLDPLNSPGTSSGSSCTSGSCGANPRQHTIHTVMLPPSAGNSAYCEVAADVASVMKEREAEVAGLWERLRAAESELARQLSEKHAAQLATAQLSAEVASLQQERELLQEQAVALQQEVSSWQTGSLLRGGPSGEEVAAQGLLERSPSRTLASRMRELLSPRRTPSAAAAGPADGTPSSQGSFRPPAGSRSASASPLCSPRAPSPGVAKAFSPALGPLQEGERLRYLQQQVGALEQKLAAKDAQLAQHTACSDSALAAARREYQDLKAQAAAAEAAAEAVLRLRSSGVVHTPRGGAHKECRATIEGLYAQVWRERLARQKAQAQAAEQHEAGGQHSGGAGTSPAAGDVDEAAMRCLEAETVRVDHLKEDLKCCKTHQMRLEKRAEQLELQFAEYTTLLSAAEGVREVPCLGSPTANHSLPSSPTTRAGAGSSKTAFGQHYGSPVRAAITALQGHKAVQEAAELQEKLKVAQAEVASVRRRERGTLGELKAARAGRRELEHKQAMLANGLETLQRLLGRRGQLAASGTPRASGGVRNPAGTLRRSQESSGVGDGAMALLSALLRELQTEEVGGSQVVMSPQQSEPVIGGIVGSTAGGADAEPFALTLELGQGPGGGEEALSDPLDISALLPEGSVCAGTTGAPAPEMPSACRADGAAAVEQVPPAKAAAPKAALLGTTGGTQRSSFVIPAVRPNQPSVTGAASDVEGSTTSSRSVSRIPGPPPKLGGSQARATPNSTSPGKRLSRLLANCRQLSPTLSSAAEAGRPSSQNQWR